ncbi:hypothetical protein B0H11DRAFT_2188800 [Mycena galericulata]|nr:hypothetical protein B0H11DRAFT_2188800 [Mycena galericulata]
MASPSAAVQINSESNALHNLDPSLRTINNDRISHPHPVWNPSHLVRDENPVLSVVSCPTDNNPGPQIFGRRVQPTHSRRRRALSGLISPGKKDDDAPVAEEPSQVTAAEAENEEWDVDD